MSVKTEDEVMHLCNASRQGSTCLVDRNAVRGGDLRNSCISVYYYNNTLCQFDSAAK